jgi:predicted transposase YdaD
VAWKVTIEIAGVTEQEANLMTTLSQVYLEWEQQTKQQGERSLILRQLARRVGEVPEEMRSQISQLSTDQLEQLGEALLDFSTSADLKAWLANSTETQE